MSGGRGAEVNWSFHISYRGLQGATELACTCGIAYQWKWLIYRNFTVYYDKSIGICAKLTNIELPSVNLDSHFTSSEEFAN